ncbi:HET-domain-containing protein, partial [Stipitochalara longipes BDJ]
MPAYEYSPLRHRSSIRLVELLPNKTQNMNTAIRCRIHHTTMNAIDSRGLKFQALSYVWGDITGTHPIFCDENDKVILVTSNCEAALRHLRTDDQSRFLWIDAMCINQSQEPDAIRERSQQVKMMGDIYARVDTVLTWRGQLPPIPFPTYFHLLLTTLLPDFREVNRRFLELRERSQQMLQYFESRPWFYRVWTFQEIALS